MNYFIPVTAKGDQVKSYSFWFFKVNSVWPLATGSPKYQTVIMNILCFTFICCYFGTIYSECLFIVYNDDDIPKIAECIATTLMGMQMTVRIFYLIFHRQQMKDILQKFYRNIYIHKSENKKLHDACERSFITVYLMSFNYIMVIISMCVGVAAFVIRDPHSRTKPYLYRMRFLYDSQEPWKYAITTFISIWVGLTTVTIICGQNYIIGITLTYLARRYEMLQDDLDTLYERSIKSLASTPSSYQQNNLHKVFQRKLRKIIRKQQALDRFMPELQSYLSLTIFLIISFGVLLLCVLAFELAKIGTNTDSFKYVFWFISQCLEFLLVGSFGQRCTDAAAKISDSYYMCNWESLLAFGDAKANSQLIRDISFAIYRSQKPVFINGMKLVILSFITIASGLKTSMSYFMFLNTMEDAINMEQ